MCYSRLAGQYLGPFGVSKSSVNLLMMLRHGPNEGMQLHDLGELMLVSRANITGLIDHLEQKDYVTRVVDRQRSARPFRAHHSEGRGVFGYVYAGAF